MKKTTKLLLVAVSMALIIGIAVGGTIAWLLDTTSEVTNTFTTTNVDIKLEETKGGEDKEFEMVPGSTIDKDPKVTVKAGSEDCWLFVKITESANLDEYISYTVDGVWERYLPEGTADADEYVYIYKGNDGKYTAKAGDVFSVIANDQVTVLNTVTNLMMDAAKTTQPTLIFKAYACQKENVSKDDAWTYANGADVPVYGD